MSGFTEASATGGRILILADLIIGLTVMVIRPAVFTGPLILRLFIILQSWSYRLIRRFIFNSNLPDWYPPLPNRRLRITGTIVKIRPVIIRKK